MPLAAACAPVIRLLSQQAIWTHLSCCNRKSRSIRTHLSCRSGGYFLSRCTGARVAYCNRTHFFVRRQVAYPLFPSSCPSPCPSPSPFLLFLCLLLLLLHLRLLPPLSRPLPFFLSALPLSFFFLLPLPLPPTHPHACLRRLLFLIGLCFLTFF